MEHNWQLMRVILDHITRHPYTLNQDVFRRRDSDGWVLLGIAGLAIEFAGGYRWIGNEYAEYGQIQVEELATKRIRWADSVAAELLGLTPDEATYVLMATQNTTARAWLEDQVALGFNRRFEHITRPLVLDSKGHLT